MAKPARPHHGWRRAASLSTSSLPGIRRTPNSPPGPSRPRAAPAFSRSSRSGGRAGRRRSRPTSPSSPGWRRLRHRRGDRGGRRLLAVAWPGYLKLAASSVQRGAAVDARPVDPGAIRRTALLTVEAERDDVCPVGQTAAAHRLITGHRAGHAQRIRAAGCRPLRRLRRYALDPGDVSRNPRLHRRPRPRRVGRSRDELALEDRRTS